jgi:oxazoline/thiazoline synthase
VFKHVPSALCYFHYPAGPGPLFAVVDSNGNAAGNNLEEAVLQGLMELVERDAAGIWWLNRLRRPGVDLASFGEPYLPGLARFYAERGRRLWMLDLTTDLHIPAFAAVSATDDEDGRGITLGFGAHLDPAIAALRAATECNQLTWLRGDRRHLLRRGDERGREDWYREARLADHPHLQASSVEPAARREDFDAIQAEDLRDDILRAVRRLSEHGLEVLVLDLTRPDVGLSAVKVFVPGLRHFRRRLGPGRLYDVPVRLGWLAVPCAEGDCNPLPLPA